MSKILNIYECTVYGDLIFFFFMNVCTSDGELKLYILKYTVSHNYTHHIINSFLSTVFSVNPGRNSSFGGIGHDSVASSAGHCVGDGITADQTVFSGGCSGRGSSWLHMCPAPGRKWRCPKSVFAGWWNNPLKKTKTWFAH